eukprot:TRINITY_DN403_c0_g3_i1.p1 TRINITY_DN403_c0_g3~~TRINITY_DN403_c0_g3_i1.p1  ORF type:complete len:379 (+),score=63.92 TRINITY_DN403_c0_g3_i1:29-1138(+)
MSGTLLLFLLSISFAQVCYTATCGEELITNGGFETVDYGCVEDICAIDSGANVEGWFNNYNSFIVRRPTYNPIDGDYSVSPAGFLGQEITMPSNSQKCTLKMNTKFVVSHTLSIAIFSQGGIGGIYNGPVTSASVTIEFDASGIPEDSTFVLAIGADIGDTPSIIDDVSLICQCSCLSDDFLIIPGQFTNAEAVTICNGYGTLLAGITFFNIFDIPDAFSSCGIGGAKGWIDSWYNYDPEGLFIQDTAIAVAASVDEKYNAVCDRPTPAPQINPCSAGSFTIRGIFTNTEAQTACGAGSLADVNSSNKQIVMDLISSCNPITTLWIKSWNGDDYGGCNVFYKNGAWNNLGDLGSRDCNNRYAALCVNAV